MRNFRLSFLAPAMAAAIGSMAIGAPRGWGEVVVASPDQAVAATVEVGGDGRALVAVTRHGKTVIAPSPVGVVVDGADLGSGVELGDAEAYDIDESYPWNGNASQLRNHAHGVRIPVRHPRQDWLLEVRAYNDGVAWRYVIPESRALPGVGALPGARRVTGEATAFQLPRGASYWSHTNTVSYEANYARFDADNPPTDKHLTMPLTVELPGGGFACLTESDVMHYSGMTLKPLPGGRLAADFEDDPAGWDMHGAFASPWRVCIAVGDLDALVNSSIVYNVAPAPDPSLFPEGSATAWVRPGRALWQWWHYGSDGVAWDRQKGFVDAAAEMGCDYYLVDEGWEHERYGWMADGRSAWASLQELVRYAEGKGVGIWVWRHWDRLKTDAQRQEFFRRLAKAGAVGAKIDFMESESHDRLAFYRETLRTAAAYKIMVNFHGANKSAGETRTWPNEMAREGVYGLEQKGNIKRQHYAVVPFTAYIGGPKDFTPTTFQQGFADKTTAAFQLATAVLYASPFFCWADQPEKYLESPAIELIRTLPTTWGQTRVLPGSEIGGLVAFARRQGEQWWVGIINASDEDRSYDLDLSFLGAGDWRCVEAVDASDARMQLQVRESLLPASSRRITVPLVQGGGYVMRLTPAAHAFHPSSPPRGWAAEAARLTAVVQAMYWDADDKVYRAKQRVDGTIDGPKSGQYGYTLWAWTEGLRMLVEAERRQPGRYREQLIGVLEGLEKYYDPQRGAYNAWVMFPGNTDSYSDDNAWLMMGLVDAAELTGRREYAERANEVMERYVSAEWREDDGPLGMRWGYRAGGPPHQNMRAAISATTSAVAALKLANAGFNADRNVDRARTYLDWVERHVVDDQGLVMDGLTGPTQWRVETTRWTYNTGLYLIGLAMLHERTGDGALLERMRRTADAAIDRRGSMYDGAVADVEQKFFYDSTFFAAHLIEGLLAASEALDEPAYRQEAIRNTRYIYSYIRDPEDGLYFRNMRLWRIDEPRYEFWVKAVGEPARPVEFTPESNERSRAEEYRDLPVRQRPLAKSLLPNAAVARLYWLVSASEGQSR